MRKIISFVLLVGMLVLSAPQGTVRAWQCPYYQGCGESGGIIYDTQEYCDTDNCCYPGAPTTYSCYHLNGFCLNSNIYFQLAACLESQCEWCPLQ